jgi:hypothetical protein
LNRKIALALAALLAVGVAAPALSAEPERLVLEPYPSETPWKEATNQQQGQQFLREQIPSDQQIDAYRDILSAQSFPALRGKSPGDFLKGMFKRVAGACEGVRVNGPKEASEDGHAIAYGQIYCGRQKGQAFGVNMFFKVIAGDEALYVIQREIRVRPSASGGIQTFDASQIEELKALMNAQSTANAYLVDQVYLCGGASANPRCASN